MLEFIPFAPEHLTALRLQAAQAYLQELIAKPEYGAAMAGPHAWTGMADGRIVGSAGILEQWPGRAICWALLGREIRTRDFLRVHHQVEAVLRRVHREGTRRVETSVDAAFDAGHRWVRALGFAPEGLMRCYSPDGRDHVLYARIHDAAHQEGLHRAKPLASPAIVSAVSRASAREEGAVA
jgi:RimJ/RimL family protein N-acetyltransferase